MNHILSWLNKPLSDKSYSEGLRILKTLDPKNKKTPFLSMVSDPAPGSIHFNLLLQEVLRAYRISGGKAVLTPGQKTPGVPVKGKPAKATKPRLYLNEFVDVKSLPGSLQKLFIRNQDITRELSGLHQSLKGATNNPERLKVASKIKDLNSERMANWKVIDNHCSGSETAESVKDHKNPDIEKYIRLIEKYKKQIRLGKLSDGQITYRKRMITHYRNKLKQIQAND